MTEVIIKRIICENGNLKLYTGANDGKLKYDLMEGLCVRLIFRCTQ